MKNLKFYLLAALVLCAGSFLVLNYNVQAETEVQVASATDVVEPLFLESADEAMSSKIQAAPAPVRPAEIKPVPLACGADSHADCKGLNHGDSCGANGLGTCNASYPTDECLCI